MGDNGLGMGTAIHVAVLDSLTLEPWSANDKDVGQANNIPTLNNSSTEHFFIFNHNAAPMAALENFIRDTVPNGNHILMWTYYIVSLNWFNTPMPPSLRT